MKKLLVSLVFALLLSICLPLMTAALSEPLPRVIDEADVLTETEEAELTDRLTEVGEKYQCDLVVLTVKTLGGRSAQAYADDYYDDHGYRKDGVLLLVAVNDGRWAISTIGKALDRIGDNQLDDLEEAFLPHLRQREYYTAFCGFADACDEVLSFDLFVNLLIAVAIGAIAAFLILSGMKGKLKSVRRRDSAGEYIRDGSFDLRHSRDIFLYRTITRTRRAAQNSSGGAHRSSSGRTHGGRSGRF